MPQLPSYIDSERPAKMEKNIDLGSKFQSNYPHFHIFPFLLSPRFFGNFRTEKRHISVHLRSVFNLMLTFSKYLT